MNKSVLMLSVYLLGICLLVHSAAAEESLPSWVMLEQARQAYSGREYGKALELLKQTLSHSQPYPEAEMLLGEIFMLEGEYEIAAEQFRKAYAQKEHLDTPQEKYTALYQLTEIYLRQGEYKNYEDTLLKIISEDESYYKERWLRMQDRVFSVFESAGLDRLLVLYRLEDLVVVDAHRQLGWFYYKSGRYGTSIIHSLFALDIILSETIREYRLLNPTYTFSGLEELLTLLLNSIEGIPPERIEAASVPTSRLATWFKEDSNFFSTLYYLACALYALGKKGEAEELWKLTVSIPGSGEFKELSRRQLANPWIEDYLDTSSSRIEKYRQEHSP